MKTARDLVIAAGEFEQAKSKLLSTAISLARAEKSGFTNEELDNEVHEVAALFRDAADRVEAAYAAYDEEMTKLVDSANN